MNLNHDILSDLKDKYIRFFCLNPRYQKVMLDLKNIISYKNIFQLFK